MLLLWWWRVFFSRWVHRRVIRSYFLAEPLAALAVLSILSSSCA